MATEFNPEIYFRSCMNDPVANLPNPTFIPGSDQLNPNSNMNWIQTTTPPDGTITQFNFTAKPKYCSFNGTNQFQDAGYLLSQSGNNWLVEFQDVYGNVIIPAVGDDIRAETI